MNDRFRYRVWDKIKNKWLHFDFSTYPTYQDRIWQALTDGETFYQCTGLKDKNGKLIYEGDVVNDKSNHIRVVVWEQDSFKYPALKTSRYFHTPISNKLEERKVDLRGKLTFQDNIYKRDKKHFEVIGNKFENPELLKECENE